MTKKIGILLQRSFSNKFEPKALLASFQKRGWLADLVVIEDVYAKYDNTGDYFAHVKLGDLAQYDVLLVREVFGHYKYALNIIRYLRNKGKLVVDNHLEEEKMVINKLVDGQRLSQAGLPFPKTYYAENAAAYALLMPIIAKELSFPVLLKHRSSGKGAFIYKIQDRVDLENKLETLNMEEKVSRYYIQEFLPLKTDLRILYVADQVIGVMQRIPKTGEFRANFSLGGSVKPVELTDEIIDIADRAAKAVNCNFAGVDLVYTTDNRPYLLEVNRTPGFEGFTKAHKIDVGSYFVDYVEKLLNE